MAADCHAAPQQGVTQMEIESWWTTGGESTGLQKLFDAFNAANPTLCAYNAAIAGGAGSVAQARVKLEVLGGYPPDSFQVHMGHELLDQYVNVAPPATSYLSPLDSTIIDPANFPAGVVSIISGTDGKVYTVPEDIHRANVLWYSKTAFATAGIANPPTTWAEFKTDAEALKAKNIVPLAVGDSGVWAFGMVFETALIGELGADGFAGLWTGTTKWSDPKVTAALTDTAGVLGYENTDHSTLSWDQAADKLIDGSAAMTIMGDWANGEFLNKNYADYGWAPAPGNTGVYQALADSFPLPVKATDQDATKKLLAYMATAEGQDIFNPWKGSIPANIHAGNPAADQQQYTDYQKSAMKDWTDAATKVVPSMEHGAAANPAWSSEVNDALTAFIADSNVANAQAALVKAAGDFIK
jgi:glucose/mannose transport system substrate-binding protein